MQRSEYQHSSLVLLLLLLLQEEPESDAVKAEKARARAHRDRLAQMALERRAKKAEVKAEADAVAALQVVQCRPVLGTLRCCARLPCVKCVSILSVVCACP